jgi:hypothetical protein
MCGGAALTVAWTATDLAQWYLQEYLPAKRALSMGYPSGQSIGASPFFAWLGSIVGLVVCCLWLWAARICARGRDWARGTATVLFAVPALTTAVNLCEHPHIPHVTLSGLLLTASLLAGLAAVVLLWHPSSGPHFRTDIPSR